MTMKASAMASTGGPRPISAAVPNAVLTGSQAKHQKAEALVRDLHNRAEMLLAHANRLLDRLP